MNLLQILLQSVCAIYLLVIFLWTCGAFYFDAGSRSNLGRFLVVVWTALFVIVLWFLQPFWLALLVVTAIVVVVVSWWLTQKPSHDQQWESDFAKLPEIDVDGDRMTVRNLRNAIYHSHDSYECQFETREYSLSDLKAIDLLVVYWGSKWMCHPAVIFDFGDNRHLCISIEVRYRVDESYSFVRSIFRQNELIYLVTDESDTILRRTKYYQGQDCYLYRLQSDDQLNRKILEEYIRETNQLLENPRWYNSFASNCTTSFYRQRNGEMPWDWRILFNGSLDKMLYEWGRLYQGLPFAELKLKSRINDKANAAELKSFGSDLREGLPGFDQQQQK